MLVLLVVYDSPSSVVRDSAAPVAVIVTPLASVPHSSAKALVHSPVSVAPGVVSGVLVICRSGLGILLTVYV